MRLSPEGSEKEILPRSGPPPVTEKPPMQVPSFLAQARIDDTLRAMLRRTLFHSFGREPTEAEVDVQVRQEFARLSRRFRSGFAPDAVGEGSVPVAPPVPARPVGEAIAGTWLNAHELSEAEAVVGYARTQGIDSLVDAVRWYHGHGANLESAPALAQCVDEFLCVKRGEGCSPMTLQGYRSKLERFAAAFPERRPAEVSPHELGRFMVNGGEHPRTRLDWWQTLNTFYAWCLRMRHVAENPLRQALSKPKAPPGSALVLTPAETKSILRAARHTDQIGFWVLSLFAGLRTEEIRRLHASPHRWNLVRLRSHVIDLPQEVAKVYARRVPILPVLKPWLEWVRDRHLPFFPPAHFAKCRRLRNEVMAARCAALTAQYRAAHPDWRSPVWARNISRRSYISYRLASAQASYVELSNEVGNSEAMIRKHYARHVTRRDAEAYFALTPDQL